MTHLSQQGDVMAGMEPKRRTPQSATARTTLANCWVCASPPFTGWKKYTEMPKKECKCCSATAAWSCLLSLNNSRNKFLATIYLASRNGQRHLSRNKVAPSAVTLYLFRVNRKQQRLRVVGWFLSFYDANASVGRGREGGKARRATCMHGCLLRGCACSHWIHFLPLPSLPYAK